MNPSVPSKRHLLLLGCVFLIRIPQKSWRARDLGRHQKVHSRWHILSVDFASHPLKTSPKLTSRWQRNKPDGDKKSPCCPKQALEFSSVYLDIFHMTFSSIPAFDEHLRIDRRERRQLVCGPFNFGLVTQKLISGWAKKADLIWDLWKSMPYQLWGKAFMKANFQNLILMIPTSTWIKNGLDWLYSSGKSNSWGNYEHKSTKGINEKSK